MGRATELFHGGVAVSDMERSLVFYCDGLGLDVLFDRINARPQSKLVMGLDYDDFRAVFLSATNGGWIELLEYHGIETRPAAGRQCDPGGGHVAFYVDDVDDVFARLKSLGFRTRSAGVELVTDGPSAGVKVVIAEDPDGYIVELVQKPAGSTDEAWQNQFAPPPNVGRHDHGLH